jgi:hypothetical protein
LWYLFARLAAVGADGGAARRAEKALLALCEKAVVEWMRTMIAEKRLVDIMNAADPNDRDDVEIRALLVAALKESDIGIAARPRGGLASVATSCEARAAQRAPSRGSPRFRRTRGAFGHRSR